MTFAALVALIIYLTIPLSIAEPLMTYLAKNIMEHESDRKMMLEHYLPDL